MTTEDALLRAILENPAEDTPRLAYADHLDETPTPKRQARAELIRMQIANKRGFFRKEDAILKKWASAWLPAWERKAHPVVSCSVVPSASSFRRGYITDRGTWFRFERGFISRARIVAQVDTEVFLFGKLVHQLLANHPVEMVTLTLDSSDPMVEVKIENRNEDWHFTAEVKRTGDEGNYTVHGIPRPSRMEFLRAMPDELERIFHFIIFEPEPIPF